MGYGKQDLLLAKRRTIAMLPFLSINFIFSIIIFVFISKTHKSIKKINDYKFGESDYNIKDIALCLNYKNEAKNENDFIFIFDLNKVGEEDFDKLKKSVKVCFNFSIGALCFIIFFLLISIYFFFIFVKISDEKIKTNLEHIPNRSHWITTFYMTLKIISIAIIESFLAISSFVSYSLKSDVFDNVHYFHENCLNDKKDEKRFKTNYINCWRINTKLTVFYIFLTLFIITDILSIILVILSKNYNVWSLLLNKISFGYYPYKEIDIDKGFIVPQERVVKDNENPDEDTNIGVIKDEDD